MKTVLYASKNPGFLYPSTHPVLYKADVIHNHMDGPMKSMLWSVYNTVNFRFKHVRFKEVFWSKEEFHCSQNFSTQNVWFKEDF